MKVGVIGCGFVFDLYMATWASHPEVELAGVWDTDSGRLYAVANHYKAHIYDSQAAMLADHDIDVIANFTPLHAHEDVTRAALNAGKHVYSEKPVARSFEAAKALFKLAEDKSLRLAVAPANALSAAVRTLQSGVESGLIGAPRLVYAEFDDGPIHLMRPETWVSPSGAPWPVMEEYETGCTREHAGYHLTWMCALFGPVTSMAAFSQVVTPQKTDPPLDTPDFSVACLQFASGVVGRLTCSIAAPRDQSARVIGETGVLTLPTYKDYTAPVTYEAMDWHRLSVRESRFGGSRAMRWLLGANAGTVKQVPGAGQHEAAAGRMDMVAGLAELAAAISENRPHFPPPDFALHITELTLSMQEAGPQGVAKPLQTGFAPLPPAVRPAVAQPDNLDILTRPNGRQALADFARRLKPKRRFT